MISKFKSVGINFNLLDLDNIQVDNAGQCQFIEFPIKKQLPKLKGSEAHCSCILSDADLRTLTALGINVTEEPVGYAHKLYFQK